MTTPVTSTPLPEPRKIVGSSRHGCVDSTLEFLEELINASPNKSFKKQTVISLVGFTRNHPELIELYEELDRREDRAHFKHLLAGLAWGSLLGAIVTILFAVK